MFLGNVVLAICDLGFVEFFELEYESLLEVELGDVFELLINVYYKIWLADLCILMDGLNVCIFILKVGV